MNPVSPDLGFEEIFVGRGQPEYRPLPAVPFTDPEGRQWLLTRWELSLEERTRIAAGEDLFIGVITHGDPLQPILPMVGPDDWNLYPLDQAGDAGWVDRLLLDHDDDVED